MSTSRQRYDHPSAWAVSDFAGKESICEALTGEHLSAFDRALKSVEARGIEVEDITRADFPLDAINDSVSRWVNEVQEGRGILVLTGFPIER